MDDKNTSSKYCYGNTLHLPSELLPQAKSQLADGNIISYTYSQWSGQAKMLVLCGFHCYLLGNGETTKNAVLFWSKFIIKVDNNERRRILKL